MSKFSNAFNEGIKHAEEASFNLDEVESLIEAVSSEINEATSGKLSIYIKYNLTSNDNAFSAFAATARALQGITDTRRKYNALFVKKELEDNTEVEKPICEISFSEKIYPVKLETGSGNIRCDNKDALEAAFIDILSSPKVGKVMAEVLSYE